LPNCSQKTNEDLEAKVSKDSQTQPKIIDVSKTAEFSKISEILKEIKIYRNVLE
jgi:pectate lyase